MYSGVVSLNNLPKPYRVKKILLSELYDSQTNDHDVALLKLAAPVAFNGQSGLDRRQISIKIQAPTFKNPESYQVQLYYIHMDWFTSNGIQI